MSTEKMKKELVILHMNDLPDTKYDIKWAMEQYKDYPPYYHVCCSWNEDCIKSGHFKKNRVLFSCVYSNSLYNKVGYYTFDSIDGVYEFIEYHFRHLSFKECTEMESKLNGLEYQEFRLVDNYEIITISRFVN